MAESACIRLAAPSGHVELGGSAYSGVTHPSPMSSSRTVDGLLAYLTYTSGSTGSPKGVLVRRRGVRNVLHSFEAMLRPDAGRLGDSFVSSDDDLLISVTTYCFDISALEIFWPLCFGFRLRLASSSTSRSGHQLSSLLGTTGVWPNNRGRQGRGPGRKGDKFLPRMTTKSQTYLCTCISVFPGLSRHLPSPTFLL